MTKRMISVLIAGMFAFGFVAVPALAEKPADKGQASGGSGGGSSKGSSNGDTQGGSESNPDGGGVDKPYPADGQPAMSQGESDWDGNNGCGNDDDREDDNNGWCGKKPANDNSRGGNSRGNNAGGNNAGGNNAGGNNAGGGDDDDVFLGDNTGGAAGGSSNSTQISGAIAAAAGLPASTTQVMGTRFIRTAANSQANPYEVLGVRLTRGEPLPVTGSEPAAALAAAAVLILMGTAMLRLQKVRARS